MSMKVIRAQFGVDLASNTAFTQYFGNTYGNGRRPTPTRLYDYLAPESMSLEVGDYAVVNTPTYGLTVVTVKEVRDVADFQSWHTFKWIVDKVDMKAAIERAERERLIAETKRKLDELIAQKRHELEWTQLLANDEQGQELLKRFRELTSG